MKFVNTLKGLGFTEIICERCVFVHKSHGIILAIHVDDGFLAYRDERKAKAIMTSLEKEFKMTAI